MRFYLGIDAGGSTCRARLTDARGHVLGEGRGGPANTRIGIDALHATLMSTAEQALNTAGISPDQVNAGFGIAGLSRLGARDALKAKGHPFGGLTLETDAVIANLGAHQGQDGATLILGTGSIGVIKLGAHNFTIGGYGFPISDEGSGAALGLSAIRHALRALDGRSKQSALSRDVTARFGNVTANVVAWMDQATPADYATFAPLVMDRAEAGDDIAFSIVREAALHVERFIETIFERGAPRCTLLGGLSPRLKPWLRLRVADLLCEPMGDAMDGALILAGLPLTAAAA
jgi:glucosamine kinase